MEHDIVTQTLDYGLTALAHPWLLTLTAACLALAGWLCVKANDRAVRLHRARLIREECERAEREWAWMRQSAKVHELIRRPGTVSTHPDHPFGSAADLERLYALPTDGKDAA